MENGNDVYRDFSQDAEMWGAFSGPSISDTLEFVRAAMVKHLEYENPATRITGLLAHHSIVACGNALGIQRALKKIIILLGINAALLGLIVFQLF